MIWFYSSALLCTQVKADRNSKKLPVLQQASRLVNEMAANVVASTRTGQEHLEDKGKGVQINLYFIIVESGQHLYNYVLLMHRYHGLFWDVPYQVEKRRNGVTGKSWDYF